MTCPNCPIHYYYRFDDEKITFEQNKKNIRFVILEEKNNINKKVERKHALEVSV